MAKSKYAPALFEVIDSHSKGKKKNSLALPKWWKNSTREDDAATGQEAGTTPSSQGEGEAVRDTDQPGKSRSRAEDSRVPEATAPPVIAAPQVSSPPSTAATAQPNSGTPTHDSGPIREGTTAKSRSGISRGIRGGDSTPSDAAPQPSLLQRLAHVEHGRVVLTLTPVNLCFVAGGLLIALFASYMAGAMAHPTLSGEREKPADENLFTDISDVRNTRPDPGVLGLGGTQGAGGESQAERSVPSTANHASGGGSAPTGENASRFGRKVGLNYIILQYFHKGDREDAVRAKEWLASNGVETTLEQSAVNNGWLLITRRGFDYNEPHGRQSAEAFREEIIQLGKKYRTELGVEARYTFHDPMIRKEQ